MTQTDLFPGQSGLPVDNPTESYWLKEPSEKLLGHRTTEQLPRTADVVIVGSGITGAFAAHFLKEKNPNLDIVMLEAREACWGATGRNGGHCQPAIYASVAAPHIASFELRTYSYLKALVEEYSIPCDWRTTSGVHAFYSAELFDAVRGAVARLTDGYPDLAANVAVVERGGTVPWLLEGERREMTLDGLRVGGAAGAVVQWNAASLWPYKLVAFVLERLLAAGRFNLQTNTPATGLSSSSSSVGTATTRGAGTRDHGGGGSATLWTVHTPRGTVTAPRVLLATNAYTSHLLPQFADLVVPVRGQVSALRPPPPSPSPSPPPAQSTPQPPLDIGHTFVFAGEPDDPYSRDDYLVQRPPPAAELVFGGGRKHARGRGVGVWDDASTDEPVAWYLRGELGGLMDLSHRPSPSAPSTSTAAAGESKKKQDLEPTHEWTGIMGYSRDGRPGVGVVPPALGGGGGSDGRGLAVCAGFTGHGMPNAALCAKAVVSLMMMTTSDKKGEDAEVEDEEVIDLPPEYLLTEARVGAARLLDEVDVVDAKGSLFMDFARLGAL
ncbi:hypothetical protein DL764_010970 [Monosporascus ibericus]|uniref:FAD dependent oxidoreductase domain-containing protein n=1 Tax=Monosporascus ibericus TaxID=155417 RepID=A0A4Q4SU59_9PEZI|nr:hypothetical protein DL764_010970 [Monosporascus ibericus]